jgi:hypothetical protein
MQYGIGASGCPGGHRFKSGRPDSFLSHICKKQRGTCAFVHGAAAYAPNGVFSSTSLIVLVTIPTVDRDFEAYVRETYVEGCTAGTFQDLLRRRYPLAVVRMRVVSDELFTVWYVYRDGGWRPHVIGDDAR